MVEVVADLDAALRPLGIPFVLIGAAARDILLKTMFNIPTGRLTLDVDLVVQIVSWEDYAGVSSALLGAQRFQKDTMHAQRFRHRLGILVDVLPFGGIEQPTGMISWPPESQTVMSTLGMVEATETALLLRLRALPPLDVRVCSPAGLAILKIIAWSERRETYGSKDAQDLMLLMRHYLDLEDIHPDPTETKDLWDEEADYELASARLLGRHIAMIARDHTRLKLEEILAAETDEHSPLKLATDMVRDQLSLGQDDALSQVLRLLSALRKGLQEGSSAR